MQAIVLAGGKGTRLQSVVSDLPKPLAPVAGRPFLAHLLGFLERQGVTEAVLSVGYMHEKIVDAFGSRFGRIDLRYAVEDEPLGTGGGLRQALEQVVRYPVFALNGDTLLALDYRAMLAAHRAAEADMTMALRRLPDTGRYGRAVIEAGRVTGFEAGGVAGPGAINAGVYLFGRNLLDEPSLPSSFSFERDFMEPRMAALAPLAFETDAYFIDIGVPEDYVRAQRELAG
jgi:D-glycero-alpha-D-manno-heptose 1-phosphate guanylyltransferase